ncbi:MAG TPA: dihydropteroate synthase [Thermodesulfobacteriota bacterium]|nr:dihydropteroate synthase [Thermodesulfobacteriota bacterium]
MPHVNINQKLQMHWKGRHIDFSLKTFIMGILNVTPDSFSDGKKFYDTGRAVEQALIIQEEGADIIDIGGESSQPGAKPVPADVELSRVIPVLKAIAQKIKIIVSIDTMKAIVAEAALSEGAEMVNDVSALRADPNMASLLAKQEVPVVLMHMRGTTPQHMQANIRYRNLISEIIEFLTERVSFAQNSGVDHSRIIIDPGIGFGKSIEKDNFTILKHLEKFKSLGKPILVGPSRKAFLGHLLNLSVNDREDATAAAVAVAVLNGANIVRVHDIKKIKRVVRVVDAIKTA